MKKKREKKKNKLFLMTIWLLFVAILLATSTYAWFSTNRIVYINSLNVNVRAEGGIEISADALKWKTILAIQDLIDAKSDAYPTCINQIPERLEPVSTGKTLSNGFLNMYHGTAEINEHGNLILSSTKITETNSYGELSNGKFIAFDVFLKTSTPVDLYLTNSSGATYIGDKSVGIENAVRIAFIIEGNTPTSSSLNAIQAMKSGSENTTYIWEPNYDTHTKAAVTNASMIYNINTQENNASIIPYDGIINDFKSKENISVDKATSSNYPELFNKVIVDIKTPKENNDNVKVFSIESGITKVRIYMWVEGQDIDCENNASVGDFSFNVQLTTNRS